jgi:hypothetical protein
MSEISDKLKELDKKHQQTITRAMEKNESGSDNGTSFGKNIKNFMRDGFFTKCSLFSFFVLLMIIVFIFFSIKIIYRISVVNRLGTQIQVLLEDQADELQDFQKHVKTMELEFRRDSKKDREASEIFKEEFFKKNTALDHQIKKIANDIQSDVLKNRSLSKEQGLKIMEMSHKYNDLIDRFNDLQDEVKALRVNVISLRASELSK